MPGHVPLELVRTEALSGYRLKDGRAGFVWRTGHPDKRVIVFVNECDKWLEMFR